MVRVPTRQRAGETFSLQPPGAEGLDLNTNATRLDPRALRASRNMSLVNETLSRRLGEAKIAYLADPASDHASKILGTSDRSYAYFTPAPIPYGGFWLKWPMELPDPAGHERYYVSSFTDGTLTHCIVNVSYGSTLPLTITVRVDWSDGTTTTLTAAQASGTEVSCLLVYDPVGGTLTLYIDGDEADQETGLSSSLRPRQDADVVWYLGVKYTPGTGVVANSGANAKMGPFIGAALRGADVNAVTPSMNGEDGKSLLDELREGTFQDWPNPASRMILFQYPMREATPPVVMIDASKFQNHGAYVATPTSSTGLLVPALNGNYVGTIRKAALGALSDASVNLVARAGELHTETIEGGV